MLEAGWSRDLQTLLEYLPNLPTENIVAAFQAAFDANHAATVSTLQRSLTEDPITAHQHNGFARLAVQAGRTDVFECLLPRTDFSGDKRSFENMIYRAAGSGLLEILITLTSQDCACFYDKVALTKALLIAARHGHYEVSLYLVSKSAEACQGVIEPKDRDVLVSKTSVYRHLDVPNEISSTEHSRRLQKYNAKRSRWSLEPSRDADKREPDLVPAQSLNSIEACLAGYGRFSVDDDSPDDFILPWQLADESVHARTLLMLFDQCEDFNGPQWTNSICKASAIGTPEMLDVMLAKGADPCAANETSTPSSVQLQDRHALGNA